MAMSDATVEYQLDACQRALDDGQRFTAWERDFIDSVYEALDDRHLTPYQEDKLREIYRQRVLGMGR